MEAPKVTNGLGYYNKLIIKEATKISDDLRKNSFQHFTPASFDKQLWTYTLRIVCSGGFQDLDPFTKKG